MSQSKSSPFLFCLALVALLVAPHRTVHAQDRTAWMREARWGVMTHYLADWKAR